MAETKTLYMTAAAIAAAFAAGAGADRLAVPVYDTAATPREVRFLADGQIAVGLRTRIGDCVSGREYVFDADGRNPRLNGRPVDTQEAKDIGAQVVSLQTQMRTISTAPVGVRFLEDGLALELADRVGEKTINHRELVANKDGALRLRPGAPAPSAETMLVALSAATSATTIAEKTTAVREQLTTPISEIVPVTRSVDLGTTDAASTRSGDLGVRDASAVVRDR